MSDGRAVHIIADLEPGQHLCCLYETEQEYLALLIPFLREGLERGEKVLYIVDARTVETVVGYLRDDGVDVDSYLAGGQLAILTQDDTYVAGGIFDPEEMIARLRTETARALREGYRALRVTGEMTWALQGLPGSERLIEYEARVNELLPQSQCLAICQYDRRRFDPEMLLEVLRTHPTVVAGTEVYDNFYYIPPAELLSPDSARAELRRWLQGLDERKRAEVALRESGEHFRALAQTATDAIIAGDADGRIRFFNRAAERIFGYSAEDIAGRSLEILIPEESRERHRNAMRRFLETGQPTLVGKTVELQGLRQDGEVFPLELSLSAVRVGGEVTFTSIVRDITGHQQAEQAIRQRSLELETLLTISRQLAGHPNLADLLGIIAHSIVDTLPAAEAASLWLYDERRGQLTARAWAGHVDDAISGLALSPHTSLVGLVYRSRRSLNVGDVASEPAFERVGQPALDAVRSVLGVPLLVEGRPIGALFADNFSRPHVFGDDDLRLLQSLAAQAAAAIENARMYEEIQQKVEELELVLAAASAASSTLELDRVLPILADKMATSARATFCRIALLDEMKHTLTIRAAYAVRDPDWDPGLGRQYTLAEAPRHSQAVETGETILVRQDDPSRAMSETECRITLSDEIYSALLMPLVIGDRVLGVASMAEIRHWERTPFTPDRVRLCRAMADQAAVAIENARLFEALRESEERYRSLFEGVPVGLYRITARGQILDANPALVQMLGYPDRATALAQTSANRHVTPAERARWQSVLEREAEIRNFEVRWCKADGTVIWVQESARAVRDADGRVLYYEGSAEDITERKQAELAVVEERSRIASDIHDGIIQELSSLALGIDFCIKEAESDPATVRQELAKIRELLRDNVRELRHVIHALRPVELEEQGLTPALEHLAHEWGERTGIQTHVSISGQQAGVPLEVQMTLLRLVQESLNNVRKHAAALQVWITLDMSSPPALALTVRDDGRGFDVSAALDRSDGLGLRQMRERAQAAGATLRIRSTPGTGTEIQVVLPRGGR